MHTSKQSVHMYVDMVNVTGMCKISRVGNANLKNAVTFGNWVPKPKKKGHNFTYFRLGPS